MEARKPSEEELTRAYKEAAQRLKEAKKKLRDFAINGQADKLTVSLNYVQAMLDEFLANYDLKMVQYARLDEAAIDADHEKSQHHHPVARRLDVFAAPGLLPVEQRPDGDRDHRNRQDASKGKVGNHQRRPHAKAGQQCEKPDCK